MTKSIYYGIGIKDGVTDRFYTVFHVNMAFAREKERIL